MAGMSLLEDRAALEAGGNRRDRAIGRSIGAGAIAVIGGGVGTAFTGFMDAFKTTADYTDEVAGVADEIGGLGAFRNNAQDKAIFWADYNRQKAGIADYNNDVLQFNATQVAIDRETAALNEFFANSRTAQQRENARMMAYQTGQEELQATAIAEARTQRNEDLENLRVARENQAKRRLNSYLNGAPQPSTPFEAGPPPEVEFVAPDPSGFADPTDETRQQSFKILVGLGVLGAVLLT